VHTQGTGYDKGTGHGKSEPSHFRPFYASMEDLYGALLQYYDQPWLSLRSVGWITGSSSGCIARLHRRCRGKAEERCCLEPGRPLYSCRGATWQYATNGQQSAALSSTLSWSKLYNKDNRHPTDLGEPRARWRRMADAPAGAE
jgi:hypothetical protein